MNFITYLALVLVGMFMTMSIIQFVTFIINPHKDDFDE